jgi:hypothetical protein
MQTGLTPSLFALITQHFREPGLLSFSKLIQADIQLLKKAVI